MYLPNYLNKEASVYIKPITDPYTIELNNNIIDALDAIEIKTGLMPQKEVQLDQLT